MINTYAQSYGLEWSEIVSKEAAVDPPHDQHEDVLSAGNAVLSQPLGTDAIELRQIQKVIDCCIPAGESAFRFMVTVRQ